MSLSTRYVLAQVLCLLVLGDSQARLEQRAQRPCTVRENVTAALSPKHGFHLDGPRGFHVGIPDRVVCVPWDPRGIPACDYNSI